MEETRKIGDYSVKYSMYIGHKDVALGENPVPTRMNDTCAAS